VEFSGDVNEEFETDVPVDFSKFTKEEKEELMKAIEKNKVFCFKEVTVVFDGEVTIDYEPDYDF